MSNIQKIGEVGSKPTAVVQIIHGNSLIRLELGRDEKKLTSDEARDLARLLVQAVGVVEESRLPDGYYWAHWTDKSGRLGGRSFIVEVAVGGRFWVAGHETEIPADHFIIEGPVTR